MYKWAIRTMIRRRLAALNRGDPAPLLSGFAEDAVLVFPGTSSWGGEHRGRDAIGRFLDRFVAARLTGVAEEIVMNGPPWRTTVAVLFADQATDAAGTVVYRNRAVLFVRARWGRVVHQEDFEDTHKVEAFDTWLASSS